MSYDPVSIAIVQDDIASSNARRLRLPRLFSNKKAVLGLSLLTLFVLLSVLAPVIAPGDPSAFIASGAQAPSWDHPFGTTRKGQDVLALTLWGGRTSLTVGFFVGVGATLLGVTIGLCAAFFRGLADEFLTLITNVFLLIPGLPFLVVLAAFLPPGPSTIAVTLIITGWAGAARAIRSQALSIRGSGFVEAATLLGERPGRIMFAEIMPNMASVVMGSFLGAVIYGIGAEAGLSFLGLGDSAVETWGSNLFWAANDGALLTGAWWVFVPSGAAIAIVAFALAMVNYAVDEVTNPRLRSGAGRKRRKAAAR